MVETQQKEITINLLIKQVTIPVTEQMPLLVIWSRGNKKAQTKKRLLNENVPTAVIDEKFQINTTMDVDESGKPIKPKMSLLSVASDKARGILGKAELDLSLYGEDTFNIQKLPLKDCAYEDAYIEVGLKGVQAAKKPAATPKGDAVNNESMLVLLTDLETLKKDKKKLASEYEVKVSNLNEKVNNLQTQLENTKTELAYTSKKTRQFQQDQEEAEKTVNTLQKTLEAKQQQLNLVDIQLKETETTVQNKTETIEQIEKDGEEKTKTYEKNLEEANTQTEQVKKDMQRFYDIRRFDTNFVLDAISYLKPEAKTAAPGPARKSGGKGK